MQTKQRYPLLVLLSTLLLASCSKEAENQQHTEVQTDPVTQAGYPAQLLWGDTHLHTSNSVDAFGLGNRLDAEAALRFARGEEVTSSRGVQAKLIRPLDFLVIADHSDGMGATRTLYEAPRFLLPSKQLKRWWDMMHESESGSAQVTAELIDLAQRGAALNPEETKMFKDDKLASRLWRSHNEIVDDYNQPGQFTAFIGFEYTPMPNGNNLHRVVMFRDGSEKTDTVVPLPSSTNPDPEQLWAWMAQYEAKTGGQVLAMPHNSNVSNGLMFAMTRLDGSPIDKAYADVRAKYEPVVEITQIKGDSESHPFLSPNDEFADYGDTGWDECNLSCSESTSEDDYAGSYTREALKRGLQLQAQAGVNPYAFGVIGSTDSHTSLATADENNFLGKHSGNESNVEDRAIKAQNVGIKDGRLGWHYLSSGYAAVWATSNSREAIFDAFMRREVYATTGPRIQVRMFAGYDFSGSDLGDTLVAQGYARGVPMGGELAASNGSAPSFLVSALMDPESASLDRIQIVKGWIDADGGTHEKIYNLGWSDEKNRTIDAQGKLPAVANTVDLGTGTWDNNGGAPALEVAWTDPDFDPAQSAFYYARVLEIPTPTWASLDAIKYGLELPDDVLRIHQERAYTSPIWYNAR